jgi:hypothetical protein
MAHCGPASDEPRCAKIAAVKVWPAALSALLFFLPPGATAAEDSNAAARELARKTAAFAGRGEQVTAMWRNVSSLSSSEFAQARAAFEAALKESAGRVTDGAAVVEARFTLSENRTQNLLVEEIRRGEERQVWIASWNRRGAIAPTAAGITLDKKLVWEQEEVILDVAFAAGGMLVLSPSKIAFVKSAAPAQTAALPAGRVWPRDVRGHVRTAGATFQVYLPGMMCSGGVEPNVTIDCHATEEAWMLESGSRGLMAATFVGARNYFDGRVTPQSGARRTVAPFYSAASVEEQGRTLWLLAMVDGRVQIFDGAMQPAGTLGVAWGSDIAGTDARCGGGTQVLATRPGDAGGSDAVQAFGIADRAAAPLTSAAEFPGPVAALWSKGGTSAVAIVKNASTGKYEAYTINVVCSA